MAESMRNGFDVQKTALVALFLREAVNRLSAGRAAWLWILLEPLAHVLFLMTLFGFIFRRSVAGVEGAMFIMIGLLAFFMVRNTTLRGMAAINANASLFAYRQVLPVDTVLVRAALEAFVALVCALVVLAGAGLAGYQVIPHDPVMVLAALTGLWLNGLGLALVFSVAGELVPELGKLLRMLFHPLYFVSGVMIPAMVVPQPYRDWLFVNPLLHGLELLRHGFFPQFQMASEASLFYLYGFALIAIMLGLALHLRFANRLVAQ